MPYLSIRVSVRVLDTDGRPSFRARTAGATVAIFADGGEQPVQTGLVGPNDEADLECDLAALIGTGPDVLEPRIRAALLTADGKVLVLGRYIRVVDVLGLWDLNSSGSRTILFSACASIATGRVMLEIPHAEASKAGMVADAVLLPALTLALLGASCLAMTEFFAEKVQMQSNWHPAGRFWFSIFGPPAKVLVNGAEAASMVVIATAVAMLGIRFLFQSTSDPSGLVSRLDQLVGYVRQLLSSAGPAVAPMATAAVIGGTALGVAGGATLNKSNENAVNSTRAEIQKLQTEVEPKLTNNTSETQSTLAKEVETLRSILISMPPPHVDVRLNAPALPVQVALAGLDPLREEIRAVAQDERGISNTVGRVATAMENQATLGQALQNLNATLKDNLKTLSGSIDGTATQLSKTNFLLQEVATVAKLDATMGPMAGRRGLSARLSDFFAGERERFAISPTMITALSAEESLNPTVVASLQALNGREYAGREAFLMALRDAHVPDDVQWLAMVNARVTY